MYDFYPDDWAPELDSEPAKPTPQAVVESGVAKTVLAEGGVAV